MKAFPVRFFIHDPQLWQAVKGLGDADSSKHQEAIDYLGTLGINPKKIGFRLSLVAIPGALVAVGLAFFLISSLRFLAPLFRRIHPNADVYGAVIWLIISIVLVIWLLLIFTNFSRYFYFSSFLKKNSQGHASPNP